MSVNGLLSPCGPAMSLTGSGFQVMAPWAAADPCDLELRTKQLQKTNELMNIESEKIIMYLEKSQKDTKKEKVCSLGAERASLLEETNRRGLQRSTVAAVSTHKKQNPTRLIGPVSQRWTDIVACFLVVSSLFWRKTRTTKAVFAPAACACMCACVSLKWGLINHFTLLGIISA